MPSPAMVGTGAVSTHSRSILRCRKEHRGKVLTVHVAPGGWPGAEGTLQLVRYRSGEAGAARPRRGD